MGSRHQIESEETKRELPRDYEKLEFDRIRELLAEKGSRIDLENIPSFDISKTLPTYAREPKEFEEGRETNYDEEEIINPHKLGKISLEEVERDLIEKTLNKFNYKKRQTASSLQISERTLWELTKRGEIPCVRIGRAVRYDPKDLADFIARKKRSGHD